MSIRFREPNLFQCQHHYENHIRHQISKRYESFRQNQLSNSYYYPNHNQNHNKNELKFKISRNDEYIKQASCCGMWHARDCVINHIIIETKLPDDCPTDLIDRYRRLPIEPLVRESVFDYCSEYGDGSSICKQISSSSSSLYFTYFNQIIYSLIISIIIIRIY
ncbi:hypothetical protein DERP_008444 [Dermatophagoides pteronyssinus]|uniref:Uncharacterized protein n=1 Tax=Dermatophagoides pteronyssinus TaxID=6956 RepID=A0ABQ8IVE1_DERPT|nr:hypothetical protein DERP_008444 [Dermatophagoides pteronyssinus]